MAGIYLSWITHLIVLGVCVQVFWRAAEMEDPAWRLGAMLWAGLSALAFLVTWVVLGWGWLGIIFGQLLLGVGIGVVRALVFVKKTRN